MLTARKCDFCGRGFGLGFTLIEVLIVMSVVVLLVGSGLAAYIKFNNKRRVEQAAMDFGIYLRTQQKRADAGEKPSGCNGTLDSYRVNVAALPTITATTDAICGVPYPRLPGFSLGDRAFFCGISPFDVYFQVLGKAPIVTAGNEILVSNDCGSLDYSYLVTVDGGGVITVEEQP